MTLQEHAFRAQNPPCPAVRDDASATLKKIEAAKLAFMQAARAYAEVPRETQTLSLWEPATRRNTMKPDEAIVGFIERADDLAQDIVDLDATEDLQRTADGKL